MNGRLDLHQLNGVAWQQVTPLAPEDGPHRTGRQCTARPPCADPWNGGAHARPHSDRGRAHWCAGGSFDTALPTLFESVLCVAETAARQFTRRGAAHFTRPSISKALSAPTATD